MFQLFEIIIRIVFQELQLPVLNNADCKKKYKEIGKLNLDAQFSQLALCAGYMSGGRDSCTGDSGGPLMLPVFENGKFSFVQIGIVAYGIGCGRPNIPGMYTNVQEFMHWIEEMVKLQK